MWSPCGTANPSEPSQAGIPGSIQHLSSSFFLSVGDLASNDFVRSEWVGCRSKFGLAQDNWIRTAQFDKRLNILILFLWRHMMRMSLMLVLLWFLQILTPSALKRPTIVVYASSRYSFIPVFEMDWWMLVFLKLGVRSYLLMKSSAIHPDISRFASLLPELPIVTFHLHSHSSCPR